jgi:hypothetical protein
MQHFLTKIINNKVDECVHRRFIKFSKGEFPNGGPVLHVKASKKKTLAMQGSFEYEDLIGYYVAINLPDGSYKIGGNIYTQPRVELDMIQDALGKLSLDDGWEPGKRDLRKLMVRSVDLNVKEEELTPIYDKLADDCYLLLNVTPEKGKEWAYKTGDKIPPLKKTFGKADPFEECKPDKRLKCKNASLCEKLGICFTDRTKFCKVKTGYLEEYAEFFELFLPDFPDFSPDFKELLIINRYKINDLVFPEDKDTLKPYELREKIKKAGILERIVYIDGEIQSKEVEFVV